MITAQNTDHDKQELSELNRRFIQKFPTQDVAGHERIIHPDFICIESEGRIVQREAYLKAWATDFDNSGYISFRFDHESIRVFGNTAIVRERTVYTKDAGGVTVTGYTVYTDTYVKDEGQWRCVQVQITPVR